MDITLVDAVCCSADVLGHWKPLVLTAGILWIMHDQDKGHYKDNVLRQND